MEIKDKGLIAEIKRINSELEKTIKGGKELSDIQFSNSVNMFIKIVESKDLDGFLKMSSFNLFSVVNEKGSEYLKDLVKQNTDGLEDREVIKKFIIRDSGFLRGIEPKNITLSLIAEIYKENSELMLVNIGLKDEYKVDFDELLRDEKLLDLFLSKKVSLSTFFKNVDIRKIPDKFYKDEKYGNAIFENFKVLETRNPIEKLPQSGMENKDLWKIAGIDAINFYGTDIEKFISKEQLLSAKVINYFINKFRDYSLFKKYYNEIINNDELMEALLAGEGNYKILKYIKEKDFYKVRNIVMNRIKYLEELEEDY